MCEIKDIENNIRDLLRTNEEIVTAYDSELLCSEYGETKTHLKELCNRKRDLIESLESSVNDFFEIKQNFITKRLRINSFALIPTLLGYEYKFNIPKIVDKSSNQYFCYISMMERLSREYDAIFLGRDGYYILDIAASLKVEQFIGDD